MDDIKIIPTVDEKSLKILKIKLAIIFVSLVSISFVCFILSVTTDLSEGVFTAVSVISLVISILPGLLLISLIFNLNKIIGSDSIQGNYKVGPIGIIVTHPRGNQYQIRYENIEDIVILYSKYSRSIWNVFFFFFELFNTYSVLKYPFIIHTIRPVKSNRVILYPTPLYTKFRLGDNDKGESLRLIRKKLSRTGG